MKRFIVSLTVRSRTIDPDEIGRLLGCAASSCHRRGDVPEWAGTSIGGKCSMLDHFWHRSSQGAGENATMAAHAASLVALLYQADPDIADLTASGRLELWINVGILYDTYTTSVRLPFDLIALAARLGATIEVSSYPTEFNVPEPEPLRNDP